jgi:hypothetical protein
VDLLEKLETIDGLTRKLKQEWVESKPENTDLGIYLHFYRGDDLAVAVQCELNRDTALNAGQLGAMGFNATTMAITFESYHSTLEKSPITGRRWKPQEMQFVSETYPEAWEKDWVHPCLTTTIHERGGGYGLRSQPYRLDGNELIWFEDKVITVSSEDVNDQGAGVMFDYLQHAMANPTIEEQLQEAAKSDPMARVMAGLVTDAEARQFHSDMATLSSLEERDLITGVVFSADPGSKREELLRGRFGDPDPD